MILAGFEFQTDGVGRAKNGRRGRDRGGRGGAAEREERTRTTLFMHFASAAPERVTSIHTDRLVGVRSLSQLWRE